MGGTRRAPRCRGGRPVLSYYPIDRRLRRCARVGTQHLFVVVRRRSLAGPCASPPSRGHGFLVVVPAQLEESSCFVRRADLGSYRLATRVWINRDIRIIWNVCAPPACAPGVRPWGLREWWVGRQNQSGAERPRWGASEARQTLRSVDEKSQNRAHATGDTLPRRRETPFLCPTPMCPALLHGELTGPRGNPAEKRFLLCQKS